MPQNGIAATEKHRAPFKNAVAFFERLRQRPCFAKFVERDLAIWRSGTNPGFLRAAAPKRARRADTRPGIAATPRPGRG